MKEKDYHLTLPAQDTNQFCPNCSLQMRYKYSGIFVCDKCGTELMSDYGKIKKYLNENGPTNAIELAKKTGISPSKISAFLREGKLEIPEKSNIFIHCLGCGTPIRFGEYCSRCAQSSDIHSAYIGDIPKNHDAKVRFLTDKN